MTFREIAQFDWATHCHYCLRVCVTVTVVADSYQPAKRIEWLALPPGWVSNASDPRYLARKQSLELCCPSCLNALDRTPQPKAPAEDHDQAHP
jgi:hypothetical protein